MNYEEIDLDLERIFTNKKSDTNTDINPVKKERPDNQNIIKLQPEEQEKNPNEKDNWGKNNQTNNTKNEAIKEKPKTETKKETLGEITPQDKKIIEEKISNNSSAIKEIQERTDSIAENVDDLVSLYEIVSVEMNPFVGLSKITRKRLDALEHIDKDFAELKARIEDLERNPRNTVNTQTSPADAKSTSVSDENNAFHSDIDKIIDYAIEYILKEEEIDEIIVKFIDDLKVNDAIAK